MRGVQYKKDLTSQDMVRGLGCENNRGQVSSESLMVRLVGSARLQSVPHGGCSVHEGPLTSYDTGVGDMMFGLGSSGDHGGTCLCDKELFGDGY